MKTVNEYGRMEIKEFLQNNHKYFINREISCNDTMLYAWVSDAEFQMQEGNSPTIEIPAYQSTKGYAITFTISGKGVI